MALNTGDRLGPYAVTAKIGQGGMGEVYQARDTNLDRDVALKVLPEASTAQPRFPIFRTTERSRHRRTSTPREHAVQSTNEGERQHGRTDRGC